MRIADYLKANSSFERPIQSPELERQFNIYGKAFRDQIHAERLAGAPIGSDKRGYYYCHKHFELDDTRQQIKGRIGALCAVDAALAQTQERMRGTAQADLSLTDGQNG